jgi:hypothetical protein
MNRAWENIRENIKTSAKESLGITSYSSINHGLMMNVQN